jgi:hypothetical protein
MRTITLCFSFIGLSRADDTTIWASPCVNHVIDAAVDLAETTKSEFSVLAARVYGFDKVAVKDLNNPPKVDTMFYKIAFLFGGVPFEWELSR